MSGENCNYLTFWLVSVDTTPFWPSLHQCKFNPVPNAFIQRIFSCGAIHLGRCTSCSLQSKPRKA